MTMMKRFRNHTGGNVAVIFALCLVPLITVVAFAVDYSNASRRRSELQAAADAAALAAMSAGYSNVSDTDRIARAREFFRAQLATRNLGDAEAEVTISGGRLTVSATVPNNNRFAGVIPAVQRSSVQSVASVKPPDPPFIDMFLMLDNSPSMGLGATQADIERLKANTPSRGDAPNGCAFACHTEDSNDANNYYAIARRIGAKMRIDVVRLATQRLMEKAMQGQRIEANYRTALYSLGENARQARLTEVQRLTDNLSGAKAAAESIGLMVMPYAGYNGDTQTDLSGALQTLNTNITANSGDGSTAQQSKKLVFIVSDGVEDRAVFPGSLGCSRAVLNETDVVTGRGVRRCQEPLMTSVCETMKNRGFKVAVLYTTYFALPDNAHYNNYISPFQAEIPQKMKACASDGLFFEVGPSQGIEEAMLALFQRAVSQMAPRLTY